MKVAELSDPEISLQRTGLLEDGRPYLVLDLVEGPTLEALLQARGRLEGLVWFNATSVRPAKPS